MYNNLSQSTITPWCDRCAFLFWTSCQGHVWFVPRTTMVKSMRKADWLVDTTWYQLTNQLCALTSQWWSEGFSKVSLIVNHWVPDPPRGGRILFDTAVGRYYCHARGKPAPTYAWIWLQPDGRQTIMSTNRYLDLRGMSESGYYRFHCLASNIIHGIRHTKVMATKLRVIGQSSLQSGVLSRCPSRHHGEIKT